MLNCAQLARLKWIITSRAFEQRGHLNLQPFRDAGIRIAYLEDVRGANHGGGQASRPAEAMVQRPLADPECRPCDSAVVLFTSGSEGAPKGVELTQRNLMANVLPDDCRHRCGGSAIGCLIPCRSSTALD